MSELKQLPFRDVNITGGFWADKQKLVRDTVIYAVRDRFEDTGRFKAFEFSWREGDEHKPHIFWDSDIAKWLESAADIILKNPDSDLEEQIDAVVELIDRNRQPDGYFNIYYTVVEPGKRFTNRDCHELYCAGHLIEAAVSYYYATGKDRFLKIMRDYADLIDRVFRVERSAAFTTPGHPEIELALVRLYGVTGEKKYLDLASFFINERGAAPEFPDDHWGLPRYYQSEKPIRDMTEADGHCVRACYLYSGAADVARLENDSSLADACKRLFDSIYLRKMYVTGGIGSSHAGETFTVDYDLPNNTAYTETCAAISLVYFASRMRLLDVNGKYGDVMERAMYNGVMSGLSLDGRSFFYTNPLEINLAERGRNDAVRDPGCWYPDTLRSEVFGCSCCPPNITRFIASVGDYVCYYGDDTVWVDQYMSSTAVLGPEDEPIRVSQRTGYPFDGRIEIVVKRAKGKRIGLRIPEFSRDDYEIEVDGGRAQKETVDGYLYIEAKTDLVTVDLTLDVSPRLVYADPRVRADAGKCAVCAGPVVFCAEGVDNEGGLFDIGFRGKPEFDVQPSDEFGAPVMTASAVRAVTGGMYSDKRRFEPCRLRLIPYFGFANRGETDMTVWFNDFGE
ncbi:MAG: glycoside hydrolase family 127 protein [Clostridiales bacterium]|nr:glycoside hydrolase family 127 protein [Clostridiales bacterium]